MNMNYELNRPIADAIYLMAEGFKATRKTYSCQKEKNNTEFDFVPSYPGYIKNVLEILKEEKIKKTTNILDLGCGLSTVLTYLKLDGYINLHGIDNEENYVRGMHRIIDNYPSKSSAKLGDLTNLDKQSIATIKRAKFIYAYMPIANTGLYRKAFRDVTSHMKKGAIIVDFYGPMYEVMATKLNLKKFSSHNLKNCTYYKKI